MAVFQRGGVYWYKFRFAGREIRESAKTKSKTLAKQAEQKRRRELEQGFNLRDRRAERVQDLSAVADAYLAEYELRHRSIVFARHALGHVKRFLGKKLVVDISEQTVKAYQSARLKEGAAPKSVNEEVGFLLRLLVERGDAIRSKMRREKTLKLRLRPSAAKAYDSKEKTKLMEAATVVHLEPDSKARKKNSGTRSPFIRPVLALAFNTGMRNAEIRNLTWGNIDFDKRFLTVRKSKTDAGEGRTIPLNPDLFAALTEHAHWYTKRFGVTRPDWYIFPGRIGKPAAGKERPYDPTRPVTTLKTSWKNVKEKAGVTGRFHDTRHTLITELAENGEGDQTIMDIAGHVSKPMLARYSHIRMESKRRALDGVASIPAGNAPNSEDASLEPPWKKTQADRVQNWAQSR